MADGVITAVNFSHFPSLSLSLSLFLFLSFFLYLFHYFSFYSFFFLFFSSFSFSLSLFIYFLSVFFSLQPRPWTWISMQCYHHCKNLYVRFIARETFFLIFFHSYATFHFYLFLLFSNRINFSFFLSRCFSLSLFLFSNFSFSYPVKLVLVFFS